MTKLRYGRRDLPANKSASISTAFRLATPLLAAIVWAATPATAVAQGKLRLSPRIGDVQPTTTRPAPQASGSQALQAAQVRQADYIVVVVNNEPVTSTEVRSRVVRAEQQLSQQGAALPPRSDIERQVIDRLINEKLLLQAARESGIKVEDDALEQAERAVAQQNQLTLPQMRQRLEREGISIGQFRESVRNQMLLSKLRERESNTRAVISEREVDNFIQEQKGGSDLASQELNIAQVLIALPENATEEQVKALAARAQTVAARARAGEDFSKLVIEFSDAPGARTNGGVIGLRTADRYPTLFVETTAALRAGGIGGPARSAAGFHILKVLEKRQSQAAGMTVVQNRSRHILLVPGPQLSESTARERLMDYRRKVLAGQADFATLARENSQDSSARDGGDLGWSNPGQFVPEFEETLSRLKPGEISEPLVSRFGVHLIQLQERRDYTLNAREQREVVRNILRERKAEEAYITWAQELRDRAYIEFRDPPQ